MSSQELMSKIERLTPDDYNMVVMLINRLTEQYDSFIQLSEDEMVAQLQSSIERSDQGYTKPARYVSEVMRRKYVV